MSRDPYVIRPAGSDDVATMVDWAAREGWNPGLHDAECFHRADPGGFFMGWLAEEPVGAISAVRYGDDFGFIGLYIVRPEHRGRGYGKRVWDHAMAWLGGRNIGLDGVIEQQGNYRASGFRLAHRNVRFRGTVDAVRRAQPPGVLGGAVWVDLRDHLLDSSAYDQRFFPAGREAFWRGWVEQEGCVCGGYLRDGQWLGLGLIRPCREGYKVGPLYGGSMVAAAAVMQRLTRVLDPVQPLFLDIPAPNRSAADLVRQWGMDAVFETARMYTGQDPGVDLAQVFGVCTFELG